MAASAEGFDALRWNPARLTVSDRWSLGADAQLHVTNICFDREDAQATSYPRVCNEAAPGVIPQLGASIPVGDRVGIGIGALAPPGTPGLEFGDPTDGTIDVDGERVPSPSRHANVVTDNFAVFPTVGIGVAAHPKLRLGAAFGWGLIGVESISFMAGVPGAGPTLDIRTAVSAADRFVPKVSFGFDVEPVRGLGIASVTTWTDDVDADAALFVSGESGGGFSTRVDGVRVHQAFGWETTLALRYARERWDLEFDGMFQGHARTREVLVDMPDDAVLRVQASIDGVPLGVLPDSRTVQRSWRNQWVARFGAEAVVVPERFRMRAGVSHETSRVEHGYESVENFLAPRTGVHAGVSVDVHDTVQLTAGYSYVFQPTTTVAPEDARIEQSAAVRPGGLADDVYYVNAGTYRGSLHVVAVSVLVRQAPTREEEP